MVGICKLETFNLSGVHFDFINWTKYSTAEIWTENLASTLSIFNECKRRKYRLIMNKIYWKIILELATFMQLSLIIFWFIFMFVVMQFASQTQFKAT